MNPEVIPSASENKIDKEGGIVESVALSSKGGNSLEELLYGITKWIANKLMRDPGRVEETGGKRGTSDEKCCVRVGG